MMEGKKMSRSTDNSFTVSDLEEKGYSGREIRYFLLSSHYRKPLTFSFGALDTACNTIKRLNNFIQRLIRFIPGDGHPDVDQLIYDIRKGFAEAMDDDFNISEALACLFEFVRKINISLTGKQLNTKQRDTILDTMKGINSVLRVMNFEGETLSEDATRLMEERKKARAAGDWEKSDHLRNDLSAMGIIVCDTPKGMIWTLK
jgi:cysteinyl-tRNA synthetase